ncbi:MAG: hypothetical protein ACE5I1_06915 [bacterium]
MRYVYLALLLIAFAFAVPASIKTAYKTYSGDRIDLSIEVKTYDDSAVLVAWEPEATNDILGYEVQSHNENGEFEAVGFVPALRGAKATDYKFVDYPTIEGDLVYRIKKIKTDNSELLSREIAFRKQSEKHIWGFEAVEHQNSVEISFTTFRSQEVSFKILNAAGQKIDVILPQWVEEGKQTITWNHKKGESNTAPAGSYIIVLQSEKGEFKTEIVLN